MASTYSPSLRIELIGTGDQSGLWGDTTNTNLGGLIEQAITGVEAIPMLDADYTLSALNGSVDESRNAVLIFTSAVPLTTPRNIIIPSAEKLYIVKNSTTGGQNLIIKTSGGAGITVPNGKTAFLYCDATNCHQSTDYFSVLDVSTFTATNATITNLTATNLSLGSGTTGTGSYVRQVTPTLTTPTINGGTISSATISSPTINGTPTAPTAPYGTNTTQLATTAFVQSALQALYPVGSVYINASSTTNPATLFGFGTWTEIGAGRVLVGQNASDAIFDTLGKTGGSKDAIVVEHNHTATSTSSSTSTVTDPGHTHTSNAIKSSGTDNSACGGGCYSGHAAATINSTTTGITVATITTTSTTVANSGSSGTNANLPPYIVVKMWTRIA